MSFKSEFAALLPHKISYFDWSLIRRMPRYIALFGASDRRDVQARILQLVQGDVAVVTDPQSQGHLLACALVQASFECLVAKGVARAVAIELLMAAFQKPGGLTIKLIMRLALLFSRDKRQMIERETRAKIDTQYGEQFEFEEESSDISFVSVVKRCAYFDYFQRHQLPELMPIFCAWDALWIDEIKRDRNSNIRFERPTTLGWGGQTCRFEFSFEPEGEGAE